MTLRNCAVANSARIDFGETTCRSPPDFTIAIITFSVAINGSSWVTCLSITLGYTTKPSEMFCNVFRTTSAVRNASGSEILLKNKPLSQFEAMPGL